MPLINGVMSVRRTFNNDIIYIYIHMLLTQEGKIMICLLMLIKQIASYKVVRWGLEKQMFVKSALKEEEGLKSH